MKIVSLAILNIQCELLSTWSFASQECRYKIDTKWVSYSKPVKYLLGNSYTNKVLSETINVFQGKNVSVFHWLL